MEDVALSQRIVYSGDFTSCNWTNKLYMRYIAIVQRLVDTFHPFIKQ